VAQLLGVKAPPQWLGRNLLADDIPGARAVRPGEGWRRSTGVIDNGLLYVYETGRKRGQLFDTSAGGEALLGSGDAHAALLMPRYQALDESFQKWAGVAAPGAGDGTARRGGGRTTAQRGDFGID